MSNGIILTLNKNPPPSFPWDGTVPSCSKIFPAKPRQGNSRKTLGPGLGLRSGIPCGDGSHHLRWMGRLPSVLVFSSSDDDDEKSLFLFLFLFPEIVHNYNLHFPVIDFASCGPSLRNVGRKPSTRPPVHTVYDSREAPQDQTACRAERTSRQRTRSSAILVLVLGESAPLRARTESNWTWLWCERRQK